MGCGSSKSMPPGLTAASAVGRASFEEAPKDAEAQASSAPVKYYFVLADKVRKSTKATLPALQTMLEDPELRQWIVAKELNFDDAIRGHYLNEYVSVSHRWLTDGAADPRRAPPDPKGVQLAAIKQYLTKHGKVKYMWFDWTCMWQANKEGQRDITVDEKAEFDLMLSEVNMLYLGCKVLVLLDMTYLSRFWTLYEAWLSQMRPTPKGLQLARGRDASRCEVVPIMGANEPFRAALLTTIELEMHSASLAANYLRNDDISVTNTSDKEKQLDRVSGLDDRVRQALVGAKVADAVNMALAAGHHHSLCLLKDGTVAACGWNNAGQVSGVTAWRDAVQVAAGDQHSLCLLKDGTVAACGGEQDDEGQVSGVTAWRGSDEAGVRQV